MEKLNFAGSLQKANESSTKIFSWKVYQISFHNNQKQGKNEFWNIALWINYTYYILYERQCMLASSFITLLFYKKNIEQ